MEVKIVDPETGEECPPEVQGEICCRGYNVMKGYYNNPEATAKAIDKDGWLHSGDLAVKTTEGFYRITGRIKDMIIRGGENIYPREIENFLYQMPQIEMVEVAGIADEKYGEIVGAFIKLKSRSNPYTGRSTGILQGKDIAGIKFPNMSFLLMISQKLPAAKFRNINSGKWDWSMYKTLIPCNKPL